MVAADLPGRRVLVPGGTGTVGQGVVRAYLEAGAEVVVPTRTAQRTGQFAATDRLHVVAHAYTTFAGARQLTGLIGRIDDVVAPIGGWWAGKPLWEIAESDWQDAFTGLATAHMAVLRAFLPLMPAHGAYSVIVGGSALFPVPGSGLVSMEQAAVLMMQQVAQAEAGPRKRIFALVLGPVGDPAGVTAAEVGEVAVAVSAASTVAGRLIHIRTSAEVTSAVSMLGADDRLGPA
jgi:3-oxoacyl-[acyl-carrier protein] reductase